MSMSANCPYLKSLAMRHVVVVIFFNTEIKTFALTARLIP